MNVVTFAPNIDVKDQMHLFARTLTHLSSPVFLGGRVEGGSRGAQSCAVIMTEELVNFGYVAIHFHSDIRHITSHCELMDRQF